MARTPLITWHDLTEHLLDWMGANPTSEARRDARRAGIAGLRELANASPWSYYLTRGRITTAEPYSTGTVAYDHTGGTYERQLTLTTGTWPAWAAQGMVEISNVVYEVAERKSSTVVTLSVNSNPGADVASTTYSLYRDSYPLPANFISVGELILLQQSVMLGFEHPQVWLRRQRLYRGCATPRVYTIMGSADYMNTMTLGFYPAPDAAYTVDFLYRRRPRDLKVEEYQEGTATSSSGTGTITGVGTEWAAKHVGSIIRLSSSTTEYPTSYAGDNPAAYERVVTAVNSSTSITVDDTIAEALAGVKYVISDPVDVEVTTMMTALLRSCELQTAVSRSRKDRAMIESEYRFQVILARETDARSFEESSAGGRAGWPTRLADMPRGEDVS